jgi:hypothetical protein
MIVSILIPFSGCCQWILTILFLFYFLIFNFYQVVSSYGDATLKAASAVPRIGDQAQEAVELATSLCDDIHSLETAAKITKLLASKALDVCNLLEKATPAAVLQARNLAISGAADTVKRAASLVSSSSQAKTLADLVASNTAFLGEFGTQLNATKNYFDECDFECRVERYRSSVRLIFFYCFHS